MGPSRFSFDNLIMFWPIQVIVLNQELKPSNLKGFLQIQFSQSYYVLVCIQATVLNQDLKPSNLNGSLQIQLSMILKKYFINCYGMVKRIR